MKRPPPPGEVRIIGGQWRRSKLAVADRPGLRPTPDRVRETLFNWLGQDLSGWRVLDAFAGSGALGFEAASRGAAEVLLIERDAELASRLSRAAERLQATMLRVLVADAIGWMSRARPAAFDLVLLDPPFGAGQHEPAVRLAAPLLAPQGWLYVREKSRSNQHAGRTFHRRKSTESLAPTRASGTNKLPSGAFSDGAYQGAASPRPPLL